MRYTLSYPICRVKVTRRSVLPVRRSMVHVGMAGRPQRPAVELHDLPRKAQPDARAVGLGRVEGGKDIFGDLGRDRSPVVVELDDNSLRRG